MIIRIFEKYGLLLLLSVIFSFWGADFSPRGLLSDNDVGITSDIQSGSSSFKVIMWLMLTFSGLIIALKYRYIQKDKTLFNAILIISLFAIFLLVSMVFSDYPDKLSKRVMFQFLMAVSLLFHLYSAISNATLLSQHFTFLNVMIMLCVIALLLGNGFLGNSYVGYALNKNTMGAMLGSAIVINTLVCLDFNASKRKLIFYNVVLFAFLTLTLSKTTIAIIALFFLAVFVIKGIWKLVSLSVYAFLVAAFVIVPIISYNLGSYVVPSDFIEPETLTYRGFIWDVLYTDLFNKDQINTGYGYGSYFGVGEVPEALNDTFSFLQFLNSAHNGYLDILIQLGLLSVILFVAFYFMFIKTLRNNYHYAALLIPVVHNITEATYLRDTAITWFLLLYILIICGLQVHTKHEN